MVSICEVYLFREDKFVRAISHVPWTKNNEKMNGLNVMIDL